jgi:tetratricopeptide (TPR) repeat protein
MFKSISEYNSEYVNKYLIDNRAIRLNMPFPRNESVYRTYLKVRLESQCYGRENAWKLTMSARQNQFAKLCSSIPGVLVATVLAGCSSLPKITHVPPGSSAQIALAKRAIPVDPLPDISTRSGAIGSNGTVRGIPLVEPDLPLQGGSSERVIDFFNAGNASLDQGKNNEAIAAFQKVIKLNPGFEEAWIKLALCYQNSGQEEKAVETLKQYKSMSVH